MPTAARIRQHIQAHYRSVSAFARAVNVHPYSVHCWLQERSEPSLTALKKLKSSIDGENLVLDLLEIPNEKNPCGHDSHCSLCCLLDGSNQSDER